MFIERISPDAWSVTVEPNEMGLTATKSWPHRSLVGFINRRGTLRVNRPVGAPRNWSEVAKIKLETARVQLVRVGDLVLAAHVRAAKEEAKSGIFVVRLSDGRSRHFNSMRNEETGRGYVEGASDWAEKELSRMPNGSQALFFHDKGVYSTKPFSGRGKDEHGRIGGLPVHATSGSPTRGGARGGAFVVRGKSGKVAGRYATKAEAERRVRQLKANADRLKAFRFGSGRQASSPVGSRWQVIVGNIGTVFDGTREAAARLEYKTYVIQSKSGNGRAGGESVTLMKNDEPVAEHFGSNNDGD